MHPPKMEFTIPKELLELASVFKAATGYWPDDSYLYNINPALPGEVERYEQAKAYIRDEHLRRAVLR